MRSCNAAVRLHVPWIGFMKGLVLCCLSDVQLQDMLVHHIYVELSCPAGPGSTLRTMKLDPT